MLRETLSSHAAVERLAHAVVHGFLRPTEVELDLIPLRPVVERDGRELGPLVTLHHLRQLPAPLARLCPEGCYVGPAKAPRYVQRHALAGAHVNQRDDADGRAIRQGVGHETIAHRVFGASTMGSPCRIVTAQRRRGRRGLGCSPSAL